MSLFKCEKCGCAENTALCRYNYRDKNEKDLCSECDPKIGRWHNCFEKKLYTEIHNKTKVKEK